MRPSRKKLRTILQETMLKLFGKISDFPDDSPFWGWLRQIAVNESLMRIRKCHTGHEVDLAAESGVVEENILLPCKRLQV